MLIYDMEVLRGPDEVEGGWGNPEAMGFGTAVIYDTQKDFYYLFGPDLLLLSKAKMLLRGRPRMGFNNVRFDDRVIFGNKEIEMECPKGQFIERPGVYDLLIQVVKAKFGVETVREAELKVGAKQIHDGSIGLDALAFATLGMRKSRHGVKAPQLIALGQWPEVFEYNLNDVRLTYKLIEFQRRHGFLVDGNGRVIRWPKETTPL